MFVIINIQDVVPPPTKADLENCKKIAKGEGRIFQHDNGGVERLFCLTEGDRVVGIGTIFGGVYNSLYLLLYITDMSRKCLLFTSITYVPVNFELNNSNQ